VLRERLATPLDGPFRFRSGWLVSVMALALSREGRSSLQGQLSGNTDAGVVYPQAVDELHLCH